jgi:DNA (cytosine-5)-methyltransferase 1
MWDRKVWTRDVRASHHGQRAVLRDVLVDDADVPSEYFIPDDRLPQWSYLKGAKREERVAANGHHYAYSEGAIAFPDSLDQPSRTILTGEGGATPSRFKHIIQMRDGRYRRLTPIELERLNGFPDDWTNIGMPDGRRAFMMGNALVVGAIARVGNALPSVLTSREHRPLAVVPSV